MNCPNCNIENDSKCKNCIRKQYKNKWYEENKERILQERKEYFLINKEHILQRNKIYNSNHKQDRNKREKIRLSIDSAFKLRKNCSSMIATALSGNKNHVSILRYLPYTIEELKIHLESLWESWMAWDNYGSINANKQTWQIDHIIPQSKLPYTSMEDDNFQKCWSLENLRPLSAIDNLKKYNKLTNKGITL